MNVYKDYIPNIQYIVLSVLVKQNNNTLFMQMSVFLFL